MSSFRRTVVVKSRAAGTVVDGNPVPGAITTSSIQASVQPLKSEEVKNLPEGRRCRTPFWVITDTFMDVGSSNTPDIVVVDGEDYEIEQRDQWQNGVIPHYRYLILKAQP
jgi:hypothetical protein